MIRLNVVAQLGNQMFQYAAIRTFANDHKHSFCWGAPRNSLADRLRILLGRKKRSQIRLREYFRLSGDSLIAQRARNAVFNLLPSKYCKTINTPRHCEGDVCREPLVDLCNEVGKGVHEVNGYFQSADYFEHNQDQVREWFTVRSRFQSLYKIYERQLDLPPNDRCCIHVRRTDYLTSDMGMGHPESGWALPMEYYRKAWDQIPQGIAPLIITDDIAFARTAFRWLPNVQVSEASPIVDFQLMQASQYKIIANSTFSWWAAWLDSNLKNKVLIPEFFIGWHKKVWYPNETICDGKWTIIEF